MHWLPIKCVLQAARNIDYWKLFVVKCKKLEVWCLLLRSSNCHSNSVQATLSKLPFYSTSATLSKLRFDGTSDTLSKLQCSNDIATLSECILRKCHMPIKLLQSFMLFLLSCSATVLHATLWKLLCNSVACYSVKAALQHSPHFSVSTTLYIVSENIELLLWCASCDVVWQPFISMARWADLSAYTTATHFPTLANASVTYRMSYRSRET